MEIINNNVEFSPQALSLKPFKDIWDADKSDDKRQAVLELSLVYYMCDDRSDYMYILDETERLAQIKLDLNLKKTWKKKPYIDVAMKFYRKMNETVYTKLLESSRSIVHKISEFNDTVDLSEKDKSGKFGRILGKFKIFDGKNDRESTLNEWMVDNHYAVAYTGQSKEAVANEHLKNYKKLVESVSISQSELDMYINSRS